MTVPILSDEKKNEICERIRIVREQVANAEKKAGREKESVTLIGVSKFFPAEYAMAAYQCGLRDLGENRTAELLQKEEILQSEGCYPLWHLIGTLQTRKVRSVVGHCALIHSVDSRKLLDEIVKVSSEKSMTSDILLQVNISGEETKHGFTADEARNAAEDAMKTGGIRLRGLMTMAPILSAATDPYDIFAAAARLHELIANDIGDDKNFNILSMGMSQDYIDAIQCGATHIRVGTAIFGHRG